MRFINTRWSCVRKEHVFILTATLVLIAYNFSIYLGTDEEEDYKHPLRNIQKSLQEALMYDKGTGCRMPQLDPFAPEVMQFVETQPEIGCKGFSWVKCYKSECKVVPEVLKKYVKIVCNFSDIMYVNDSSHTLGDVTQVFDSDVYHLTASDHVFVHCSAIDPGIYVTKRFFIFPSVSTNVTVTWSGYGTGLRPVLPRKAPPGRENTYNVLLFAFDSTSKNGFLRKMRRSHKFLLEEVGATIFNGYNILGDGTRAAILPILTGRTELELPNIRTRTSNNTADILPLIFYKLKADGYHTAYFEDSPEIGTFNYRFNGFTNQPADHYLRSLLLLEKYNKPYYKDSNKCFGDTPLHTVMINITEQFLSLPGKKFVFNFISVICHDEFNGISNAEADTFLFLRNFMNSERKEDTLLIVMGDHGFRFSALRRTLQGSLEERLPYLAIRLPDRMVQKRPGALTSLKHNADVLTTPHDLHATILDTLEMRQHWNPYKILGADLTRALTMLKPIPPSRSCSEAGVAPHWCACLAWSHVAEDDPLYQRAVTVFVEFVNKQTYEMRSKCAIRKLKSVDAVKIHRVRDGVAEYISISGKDLDKYARKFRTEVNATDILQVKVTLSPGDAMFEASLSYRKSSNELEVNPQAISRINRYNHEPDCVIATHPHLSPYCYCKT